MPDLQAAIRVISDSAEFRDIHKLWDGLVRDHSENPFLLAGFVREFMELRRSNHWQPLLLVLSVHGAPIGVMPLATKRMGGLPFVEFLLPPQYGPDLLVSDRFRELSVNSVLRFLFHTLHFQFLHLVLPAESPNLPILRMMCKQTRVRMCEGKRSAHYVLSIHESWTEFESLRGSNFRRQFKRIVRNLDRAGSWTIIGIDDPADQQDLTKRILDVEHRSWKEDWRRRSRRDADGSLLSICRPLQHVSGRAAGFHCKIWFLELNSETIAYNLVLQSNQSAFMAKMSFDERFRNLYPGVFLANHAIRDIFNAQTARSIDFLTSWPFLRRWAPVSMGRVELCICRKGILPTILASIMMMAWNSVSRGSIEILHRDILE
jgi:CelD/BcsL family acetyltransferase involved in cellulose biosynthesis